MTAPTTRRPPAPSPAAGGQPARAHRKPRAKPEGEARQPSESARVVALAVQHPHAAGIDIGSRSHWVCVGFATDADPGSTREFPAHTAGLKAIAAFLGEHRV